MNTTDYTYLINKPHAINERQFMELEAVLENFPYFQSARTLRLKHLYNQDSFRYNHALKVAAAFTTDRSVLFDFITSDNFNTVDNKLYDQKVAELLNMDVIDLEIVEPQPIPQASNPLEQSLLTSIKQSGEATTTISPSEEKLGIGKPLEFNTSEKHSFQEWLQLSRLKPIERKEIPKTPTADVPNSEERKKKLNLIDKFIETNPKIPAIQKDSVLPSNLVENEDKSYLMTETLAKVYLEQKKYQRAIQAYEILILKYPEKSSFFADRIEEIKLVQQNNN
ncbi:MAG: hypothetical protein RLZZ500_466 [Bacteroidota bacterium]|jgi:tetratricopeptide (TPR) repeat protein